MTSVRDPYLDRARRAAELTIPTLFPPEGHHSSSDFNVPWQSVGAQGVNTLAAKLSLSLIPPNSPFFRLRVDNKPIEDAAEEDPDFASELDASLAGREQAVLVETETSAVRVTVDEAMKQLVVGGNSMLYLPPEGGIRTYSLENYVVSRDPLGTVLEIITCDHFEFASLPEPVQTLAGETQSVKGSSHQSASNNDKPYQVYTHVQLKDGRHEVYQEINGTEIPGSRGSYPREKSPFIALRMFKVDGEDYGRGYVEMYIGDLKSLDELVKAIVEGSLAAARVLFMVDEASSISESDIAEADNTDVITGRADDVSVLQVEKFADFRTAGEQIQRLEQRLAFAFLMTTAVQRNAERVTAEEIRVMVRELEEGLGGIYSILSQELQLPLVNRLIDRMERQNRLKAIPKGVKPQIVTGIEALGRGTDLAKLQQFIQIMAGAVGPEALAQVLNPDELARRVGTATSVDTTNLIKTQDQLEQEQRQAQMMELLQRLAPGAAQEAVGMVRDQQDPARQPQPQQQS